MKKVIEYTLIKKNVPINGHAECYDTIYCRRGQGVLCAEFVDDWLHGLPRRIRVRLSSVPRRGFSRAERGIAPGWVTIDKYSLFPEDLFPTAWALLREFLGTKAAFYFRIEAVDTPRVSVKNSDK